MSSRYPRPLQPEPLDAAALALADGWRQLLDAMRAELREQVAQLRPAVEPFNMLTIAQTAEFFGVGVTTLVRWERDGALIPFRHDRTVLYDTRAIDAFVRERQGELVSRDEAA